MSNPRPIRRKQELVKQIRRRATCRANIKLTSQVAKELCVCALVSNVIEHHQQSVSRSAECRRRRRKDGKDHAQGQPHCESAMVVKMTRLRGGDLGSHEALGELGGGGLGIRSLAGAGVLFWFSVV